MSVNFTLHESANERKPSVFAASFLYLMAQMGLYLAPYLAYPINYLIASLIPGFDVFAQSAVLNILYYGAFICIPVMWYMEIRPSCAGKMRLNPLSGAKVVLVIAAAVAGAFFTNYITTLWMILIEAFGGHIPPSSLILSESAAGMAFSVLLVAVLPAVCEELLFRGIMLSAWETKGSVKAMFIVSLWFTMLHGRIESIPVEFLSAAVIAFIVISTDSLFAGMIYHTVHNGICLILSYMAAGAPVETSGYQAIGGIAGILLCAVYTIVYGAMLFFVLKRIDSLRIREKRSVFGVPPLEKRDDSFCETVVISVCAVVCGFLYLMNILQIAGLY